ncbi:hypothetical protein GYMLUDRAFT_261601 [Collybiopsis luxurians FD-317 M1]|uniref:Uncharacterized protein n=1 Tax=Collybiopsis luxurians FD-317 M1 TaxID=944289 RepID=A0A0D0B8R2_9AGAR|nr:hypothetical protein GYMLUDRAFT_261601 [Collybiopsis luxurians FD-317 M1]
MPNPTSALQPKLQPTRRGNAEIQGIAEVLSQNYVYVAAVSYSKKDGIFRQLNQEISGSEDDEDDEPAFDSDLVLLHQHIGDYIDSDEEVDPNPKHPPASKTSNAQWRTRCSGSGELYRFFHASSLVYAPLCWVCWVPTHNTLSG